MSRAPLLLARVLLVSPSLPDLATTSAALKQIGLPGARVRSAEAGGLVVELERAEFAVRLLDEAVPAGEAERAADNNPFWAGGADAVAKHRAHLEVTGDAAAGDLEALLDASRVLGALASAPGTVAVCWAPGSTASAAADWLEELAQASPSSPPLGLWLGMSVRFDGRQRLNILSRGMPALGGRDVWMTVRDPERGDEAMEFALNLCDYQVLERAAFSDRDRVGFSADEQLVVRVEASPVSSDEDRVLHIQYAR
jgi:hypothetical protein